MGKQPDKNKGPDSKASSWEYTGPKAAEIAKQKAEGGEGSEAAKSPVVDAVRDETAERIASAGRVEGRGIDVRMVGFDSLLNAIESGDYKGAKGRMIGVVKLLRKRRSEMDLIIEEHRTGFGDKESIENVTKKAADLDGMINYLSAQAGVMPDKEGIGKLEVAKVKQVRQMLGTLLPAFNGGQAAYRRRMKEAAAELTTTRPVKKGRVKGIPSLENNGVRENGELTHSTAELNKIIKDVKSGNRTRLKARLKEWVKKRLQPRIDSLDKMIAEIENDGGDKANLMRLRTNLADLQLMEAEFSHHVESASGAANIELSTMEKLSVRVAGEFKDCNVVRAAHIADQPKRDKAAGIQSPDDFLPTPPPPIPDTANAATPTPTPVVAKASVASPVTTASTAAPQPTPTSSKAATPAPSPSSNAAGAQAIQPKKPKLTVLRNMGDAEQLRADDLINPPELDGVDESEMVIDDDGAEAYRNSVVAISSVGGATPRAFTNVGITEFEHVAGPIAKSKAELNAAPPTFVTTPNVVSPAVDTSSEQSSDLEGMFASLFAGTGADIADVQDGDALLARIEKGNLNIGTYYLMYAFYLKSNMPTIEVDEALKKELGIEFEGKAGQSRIEESHKLMKEAAFNSIEKSGKEYDEKLSIANGANEKYYKLKLEELEKLFDLKRIGAEVFNLRKNRILELASRDGADVEDPGNKDVVDSEVGMKDKLKKRAQRMAEDMGHSVTAGSLSGAAKWGKVLAKGAAWSGLAAVTRPTTRVAASVLNGARKLGSWTGFKLFNGVARTLMYAMKPISLVGQIFTEKAAYDVGAIMKNLNGKQDAKLTEWKQGYEGWLTKRSEEQKGRVRKGAAAIAQKESEAAVAMRKGFDERRKERQDEEKKAEEAKAKDEKGVLEEELSQINERLNELKVQKKFEGPRASGDSIASVLKRQQKLMKNEKANSGGGSKKKRGRRGRRR